MSAVGGVTTFCVTDRYISAVLHAYSTVVLPMIEFALYSPNVLVQASESVRRNIPRLKHNLTAAVIECVSLEYAADDPQAMVDDEDDEPPRRNVRARRLTGVMPPPPPPPPLQPQQTQAPQQQQHMSQQMVLSPSDATQILRCVVNATRPMPYDSVLEVCRYYERASAAVLNAVYAVIHTRYGSQSRSINSCVSGINAILHDLRRTITQRSSSSSGSGGSSDEDTSRKRKRSNLDDVVNNIEDNIVTRCNRIQTAVTMLMYVRLDKSLLKHEIPPSLPPQPLQQPQQQQQADDDDAVDDDDSSNED